MRSATGSALIAAGGTRVICTASVQESVPKWLAGQGRGWLTAEYGMLPASTGERKQRDVTRGRLDGRTVEIQRLIGRSIRGVVDFAALGERTVYVDCDVLEADGGTRCAAITGGYVALELACRQLLDGGAIDRLPLTGSVAAVSCGIVDGEPLLDLDYPEDSAAEVDANVVMTGDGGLVEVQATAERTPLSRTHLDELLALAAARHRAPARRPGRRPELTVRLVLATRNAHKQREFARLLPGSRDRGAARRRRAAARDRRHLRATTRSPRRARPPRPPAGRRSPTTPASRPPRSAAPPACARPATPARTPPTRRTSTGCGARRRPAAALAYVCARRLRGPRQRRGAVVRGPLHRHAWPPRRAGAAGSATTRRSCPTTSTTSARWPSSPTRRRTRSPTAAGRRGRSRAGSRGAGGRHVSPPRHRRNRGAAPEPRAAGAGPRPVKTRAAALSIASNSALILLKVVAGAITGSVAILSEAMHSSIDLIASIVAFISVRKADEPADADHRYGHEKIENLVGARSRGCSSSSAPPSSRSRRSATSSSAPRSSGSGSASRWSACRPSPT